MSLVDEQEYSGRLPDGLRVGDERFFADHLSCHLPSIWTTQLHDCVFNEAGELFDENGVLEHSFMALRHLHRDTARFQRRHAHAWADPVPLKGSYLWITDRMSHNYHHWICDCLPRLEAWLSKNSSAELLLPRRVHSQPFVTKSLAAYPQVRAVAQPPGHSAQVEMLVLPDRTSPEGFHHPLLMHKAGRRLRAHFAPDVAPSNRRILVSRENARFRRLANEDALFPAMRRLGFEKVHFEQMGFDRQIALMAQAQMLCGPHGAGLTNMLFMPPGRVIELRQPGGTPNCFFTLANVCGHAYRQVACEPALEGQPVHTADISAGAEELESAISAA
ncbi:MAG: glycosyltransferase family 61 protein [Nitratireductor sp.]|nr:glycosyltransferase family 61 protein [Nitratireductor sp.]